jgi:hypothetical protein
VPADGHRLAGLGQPGDAEVGQVGQPLVVEQDVVGLQVAVDDILAVGLVQRRGQAAVQPGDLVQGQRAVLQPLRSEPPAM